MFSPFLMRHLSIYYMLIACFYFALVGAASKILSEQINSVEIVFFRNLIGLIIVLFAFKKLHHFGAGGHFGLLVFRALVGRLACFAFFIISQISTLARLLPFKKQHRFSFVFFQQFCLKKN